MGYTMYLWSTWHIWGMHGKSMGCVAHLWGTRCIRGACGSPMGYMPSYLWGVWHTCGVHTVTVGCMTPLWAGLGWGLLGGCEAAAPMAGGSFSGGGMGDPMGRLWGP